MKYFKPLLVLGAVLLGLILTGLFKLNHALQTDHELQVISASLINEIERCQANLKPGESVAIPIPPTAADTLVLLPAYASDKQAMSKKLPGVDPAVLSRLVSIAGTDSVPFHFVWMKEGQILSIARCRITFGTDFSDGIGVWDLKLSEPIQLSKNAKARDGFYGMRIRDGGERSWPPRIP